MNFFERMPDTSLRQLSDVEAAPYIAGTKRYSTVNGVQIIFTAEQELARNAEEAAWALAVSGAVPLESAEEPPG